jgi:hypothetical protein
MKCASRTVLISRSPDARTTQTYHRLSPLHTRLEIVTGHSLVAPYFTRVPSSTMVLRHVSSDAVAPGLGIDQCRTYIGK